MNEQILEDLSIRFITPLGPTSLRSVPRLYFALEEAHWFYLDFAQAPKLGFKPFADKLLRFNRIPVSIQDLKDFQKYKRSVPVYGCIIFNQDLSKILLVKGYNQLGFYFPKGKKDKDEKGIDCAVREVFEEIGVDFTTKIINWPVTIDKRLILYPVINVSEDTKFKTLTRNEIDVIKWVNIRHIQDMDNEDSVYVKRCYGHIRKLQEMFIRNIFKFNVSELLKCWT